MCVCGGGGIRSKRSRKDVSQISWQIEPHHGMGKWGSLVFNFQPKHILIIHKFKFIYSLSLSNP